MWRLPGQDVEPGSGQLDSERSEPGRDHHGACENDRQDQAAGKCFFFAARETSSHGGIRW
jgi:hypothetical protein